MRWYVRLTWWTLRALGVLPLPALYAIGGALGRPLWWRRRARERVHTEVNMRIARPDLDDASRDALVRACLVETGHAVTEMAAVWGRGARRALRLVREVQGLEHFEAALRSGRGLIVAAPHLGCWELLNYWLCAHTPIAILYAPPRDLAWEALLVRARGELAPEQVRADGAGVRSLYKRLASGGVVGILPDQQPKRGEGQFAPFFGLDANTMVLLPRIAHRTGSTVLFAFAERLPRGAVIASASCRRPTALPTRICESPAPRSTAASSNASSLRSRSISGSTSAGPSGRTPRRWIHIGLHGTRRPAGINPRL